MKFYSLYRNKKANVKKQAAITADPDASMNILLLLTGPYPLYTETGRVSALTLVCRRAK